MPIPASHIVNVLPRVIDGGSQNLELNGLLLSENPIISASTMVLGFPTARAVGDYFGINSAEYEAAVTYFTGYDNKFAAPREFFIARRVDAPIAGWLRSARNAHTLEQYKAITDGGMVITINNTAVTVASIDFSAATSFSDVAATLQTALMAESSPGAVVTFSSLNNAFTITSGTTGVTSEVGYAAAPVAGTDLAAFMGLREQDGAVLSPGMDTMNVNEQMDAIRRVTENWVSFTTAWEADAAEMLEWAAWANDNYGWLYVAYTTAPTTVSPDSTIDPASVLANSENDHTCIIYGPLDYACFIMGIVASIAWTRVNGAITAAFKRQAGLAPWVVDEATAAVLESKNCNYVGNFATRNAEFVFLYPGCLSDSDYRFIDPYVNSIWLNNRLQVSLMDGLTTTGRPPYNVTGYTMVRGWMRQPVNEALVNGVIEPGVSLSEIQKSELFNEAGLDISDNLWTDGYYIQVLDPGPSVRAERGSPIVSLWYTYGGAIQKIEVASTAVL